MLSLLFPSWKLTYPLKIDAWNMDFSYEKTHLICRFIKFNMWATGKTLIAKCDLGSKLSFSGVRYIVLQCFLPPSKRSPLKCMQEHFSQRHVRFCSVFHCFALILLVRIDRLKSKDFSYEPFDFWGIHHVKAFYAEMVIVWLSFWLSFNPM